jgi:hypothetical protein
VVAAAPQEMVRAVDLVQAVLATQVDLTLMDRERQAKAIEAAQAVLTT